MAEIYFVPPEHYINIMRKHYRNRKIRKIHIHACGKEYIFFIIINGEKRKLIIPYKTILVCKPAVYRAIKKLMN